MYYDRYRIWRQNVIAGETQTPEGNPATGADTSNLNLDLVQQYMDT